MTREEEIAKAAANYCETNEPSLVRCGDYSFIKGAEWSDKNKKSPWISVEDDLPCNHEDFRYFGTTVLVFAMLDNLDVTVTHMCKNKDTKEWYWKDSENVTHWMPIPKLP